jgi:hypothetical protein
MTMVLLMFGSPENAQTYRSTTTVCMYRPCVYWLAVRYRNIDRLPDKD